MHATYVNAEAARRLKHGQTWVRAEEILRMDGPPPAGEPVRVLDPDGHSLGLADLDLGSKLPVRRIGLPDDVPEGLLPRQIRRALARRSLLMEDPRFCRVVHDEGDALPGLVVDRYGDHFAVQTSSRAMDARAQEISRALVEVASARSVVLRNDGPRRAQAGLGPEHPRALFGTPPRWVRVLERGARYSADLTSGAGFPYDQRALRRRVGQLAHGARVLNPFCFIGSLFVPAGLQGARSILAFDADRDAVDLARENAEANGLIARAEVELGDPVELLEAHREPFDLVALAAPEALPGAPGSERETFVSLVRLCARSTRHGGRLVVAGYHPPLPEDFDAQVALGCELAGRVAYRLARIGLPLDFPTVLGSPGAEYMTAVAV
ncbi:MAG TPA: class I SAM-dependent rRNA methyltransferase, partial [Myxococcales bacterium]|nr:class I SAM-dependent rRNA methyltransferase [Myxococcales bacterium]